MSHERHAVSAAFPWLVSALQMRALDAYTIDDVGIPSLVLMESAGGALAREVARRLGDSRGLVAVVAGPGNNGGDGFVAARRLRGLGFDARVWLLAEPERLRGDARTNHELAVRAGVPVTVLASEAAAVAGSLPAQPAAVVDAMLGTGARGAPRGRFEAAIRWANERDALRVAADVPTGVDADTGAVPGVAFRAHCTVTFGLAKLGLWQYPGRAFAGDLVVADIGIAPAALEQVPPTARLVDERVVEVALPPLPPWGHKGTAGHVLVVAGTPGKAGAALLAARAALCAGAGLVTVATDEVVQAHIEGRVPEVMVEAFRAHPTDAAAATRLARQAEARDVAAVGPGLGATPATRRCVEALLETGRPVVADADALNAVGSELAVWKAARGPVVLTPHPGEAARMLENTTAAIQADRPSAARTLAERTGAVVVLKGASTLVASPDGFLWLVPTGTPAMATAGAGDALTGIIAAALARARQRDELPLAQVVAAAAWLHGRAGECAEARLGTAAVTAGAIIDSLGAAWPSAPPVENLHRVPPQ